ncbi:MAG: hypothetical protein JRM77_07020 [Nitrososphaerota archaeon]|nr:hypothetical protein [Nitrososphaerota archaeon]
MSARPNGQGKLAIGAIMIVAGFLLVAFQPFSVFAAAKPTVDCSAWPSDCSVTAQISNSGGWGTAPFTVYFVYRNSASQVVLIGSQTVSVASGQTAPVTDSGFNPQSVPGAGTSEIGFSVTVYVEDSAGLPSPYNGPDNVAAFSVPMLVKISYGGVGSITVSPPGTDVQECASGCATGFIGASTYSAYWPGGTVVKVVTSGGVSPLTIDPSGSCSPSGSGFSCTFTVSNSLALQGVLISGSAGSALSQNIIYVGDEAAGGSPASVCLSATSYATGSPIYGNCAPTGSFSISVPTGYTWSGNLWSVVSGGLTLASGNSTTVSLSYSALSSKVSFSSGVANLLLTEASTAPTTPGGSGGGSSCVLNPSTNAGVDVLITTTAGKPIGGALVTGAGASAVTDNTGHALLCNFPVPKQSAVTNGQGSISVTVSDSSYSTVTQSVNVIEGQTTNAVIQMSGFGVPGISSSAIIGVALLIGGFMVMFAPTGKKPRAK